MRVFEFLFEMRPENGGWRLMSPGRDQDLRFDTYFEVEQRARWLAVRKEVRGFPTEIRVVDASGEMVGAWRGERYQPVQPVVLNRAA